MSGISLPNNLKDYLINEGTFWNTYFYQDYYIKMIDNFFHESSYQNLLEALKKEKYQMEQICKVIEVIYQYSKFYGYICEDIKAPSIHQVIQTSFNPYCTFYEFFQSFQNILEFTINRNMITKDIITSGNIRYNRKTKTAFLIDIDSIQIPEYGDNIFSSDIVYSRMKKILLSKPKYYEQGKFKTEFNIFSLYELFLQTIYQKSLLAIDAQNLQELEQKTQELLGQTTISQNSDLYGRIMDTLNPNIPNSYDKEDFRKLAETCKFPLLKKIRK